ncbi:MAG: methyltransferase domain-containing protein [Phycisphaerales bacterium]|nr:methyltransferase domain-containing protein [Phycisphaerales bacterium]
MSFGLGHGNPLDPAPGVVAIDHTELPPLPDTIMDDPESGRLDPRSWFANPSNRFELEIGSGKGAFLVQQAELQPDTNFLGIEWAGEFAAYTADRIRRRRENAGTHTNVRVLNSDAAQFLQWRCPDGIIDVLHLYFSDPWPKTKHHKKRVIQHQTLFDIWRCLKPGGELRVVTDHDDLWAWDLAHFDHWASDPDAKPLEVARPKIPVPPARIAAFLDSRETKPYELVGFDKPESAGEGELVGTNFERKVRVEGRSFNAGVLRKIDNA